MRKTEKNFAREKHTPHAIPTFESFYGRHSLCVFFSPVSPAHLGGVSVFRALLAGRRRRRPGARAELPRSARRAARVALAKRVLPADAGRAHGLPDVGGRGAGAARRALSSARAWSVLSRVAGQALHL